MYVLKIRLAILVYIYICVLVNACMYMGLTKLGNKLKRVDCRPCTIKFVVAELMEQTVVFHINIWFG